MEVLVEEELIREIPQKRAVALFLELMTEFPELSAPKCSDFLILKDNKRYSV